MLDNQREQRDSFILVVGGDANARQAVIEILEMYRYPAVGARNGKEGLSYLRSSSLAALIVLDLMMPIMNGSVLGCEQENDSELAAVPAISLRARGIEVFDAILTPANLKFLLEFVSNASCFVSVTTNGDPSLALYDCNGKQPALLDVGSLRRRRNRARTLRPKGAGPGAP
jgi:CheY-like chemotaxis protein